MYGPNPCAVKSPASNRLETALEVIRVAWKRNDPLTLFLENVKRCLEPVASN